MTVPIYLQPAFNFLQTAGVTDVANTITRIVAQAVALGWSNPGAGHIKSPPNAVGQFIDLQFNKIAATNLEMVFTDSLSRTFTRRCQTPSPFTERLYLNLYGFWFDPGNGEGLWASILDASPELQDCHDQTFAGHGSRDAVDTLDNLFATGGAEQLSSANPRVYTPKLNAVLCQRAQPDSIGSGGDVGIVPFSSSLSRLWYPIIHEGPVTGTVHQIRGRAFQALFCGNTNPVQSEIVVPIDEANTGLFKVLSFINNLSGTFNGRIAVRKA